MVDQIGRFVDHVVVHAGRGGQDRLHRFLANLLGDPVNGIAQQSSRVAGLRIGGSARLNDRFQFRQKWNRRVSMLAKARLKAEFYVKDDAVSFQQADITKINMEGTGAFILNYTLQFIRPVLRPALISQLYENLRPGGLLILSEKTILEDKRLNRAFIDIHHDFKRAQGYSDLEITRKREALENILIPFTIEENIEILAGAGFKPITTFLQWFNFSSFVAIKPS